MRGLFFWEKRRKLASEVGSLFSKKRGETESWREEESFRGEFGGAIKKKDGLLVFVFSAVSREKGKMAFVFLW